MLLKASQFLLVAALLLPKVMATPLENVTERKLRAYNLARVSGEVLKGLLKNQLIKSEYLNRARAVAVFPAVGQSRGLLKTTTGGRGVVSRRSGAGWTAPAFFEMKKPFGSMLGPAQTTIVLLFNEDSAANTLSRSKITFARNPRVARESDSAISMVQEEMTSYEFVAGIPIGSFVDSIVLKPSNADNQLVYELDAKDVLFYQKEGPIKNLELHNSLEIMPNALNDASPNVITPDVKDFPDAGYDYKLSRSASGATYHMEEYFNSRRIRYRVDPTNAGMVITAFVDLPPKGRRHRRAAFFLNIRANQDELSCSVLFKWLVQSQGFRESDWTTDSQDTSEEVRQQVDSIDSELKRLKGG
jgi:lipid-binding SYLF domain-containing protein